MIRTRDNYFLSQDRFFSNPISLAVPTLTIGDSLIYSFEWSGVCNLGTYSLENSTQSLWLLIIQKEHITA